MFGVYLLLVLSSNAPFRRKVTHEFAKPLSSLSLTGEDSNSLPSLLLPVFVALLSFYGSILCSLFLQSNYKKSRRSVNLLVRQR